MHATNKNVVCHISHKTPWLFSEDKDPFFAMDIKINKTSFEEKKVSDKTKEFRSYMKLIGYNKLRSS